MAYSVRLYCIGVLLLSCCGPACVHATDKSQHKTALRGAEAMETEVSLIQTAAQTMRVGARNSGVPELLESYQDGKLAITAHPDVQKVLKEELVKGITPQTYLEMLHRICDKETSRFVGLQGNLDASNLVQTVLNEHGLTKTWTEDIQANPSVQKYAGDGKNKNVGPNVFGFLEGSDEKLKKEVILVGAHYDSVNWEKTGGVSPGVDDNGSGSAAVQLVARALAQSPVKPKRSFLFAAFNAEEEGLVGSTSLAAKIKKQDYPCDGCKIKYALIADEVAYGGKKPEERQAIIETLGNVDGTHNLVDTMAQQELANSNDGINGFLVNWHGFASDHIPLLNVGVPTALLIERNNQQHNDEWGHSSRDNFDHIDPNFGASMTRLLARTAATLGSPAQIGVVITHSPIAPL
jgi:hypothetical protein